MANKSIQTKLIDIYLYMRTNVDIISNHLLIIAAFFLPISRGPIHDIFQILLILFIFLKPNKLDSIKSIFKNKVIMAFFIYVLMAYIWVFVSDDFVFSYSKAKDLKYFLFSALIFVFLEHKYINRLIGAFLLGIFVSELFSYALSFGFLHGPFLFSYELASLKDPSPFQHHIHYGFMLAIASNLLLILIIRASTFTERVIELSFFIIISINLVLNVSRTGYILYVIGTLIVIFLYYKKSFIKVLLISIVGLFLASLLAYKFSNMFHDRVDLTIKSINNIVFENNYSSSIGYRFVQYGRAIDSYKQRPITAHGTGMHLLVVGEERGNDLTHRKEKFLYSCLDSQYFDLLVQFGVVGLIVFFNIFYQIIRYRQSDIYLKNIQYIFVALYLLYSLQTGSMRVGLVPYLLFFLITVTLVHKTNEIKLNKVSFKELLLYILCGGTIFLVSPYVL